ncbi:MAG: response regulator [candidate division Zixibacteria bacterium]|jgi:CheY-like chemotaxis protein|nr:response regulator [candidate division Zixibacteria bacterium]
MDPKKAAILLIEDDPTLIEMYQMKFRLSGLKLLVATGGYSGLAMVKKVKPDLVLLDIRMDDLDGFEVLKRMKADPTLKDIPVYLLTNMGEKDAAEKGKRLGADAYVMKAKLTPQEVVDMVSLRLNESQSHL